MSNHSSLDKIVTKFNGSSKGDVLSALWHFLCFSAMAKSDVVLVMNQGKIKFIKRNDDEIEPTVSGINKAMTLGRCQVKEQHGQEIR